MPFYWRLKSRSKTDRKRIVGNLQELRRDLVEVGRVPPRTVRDTLLLASWNLRDFDSNKFGYGPRLDESFYYIAEVISSFDLVAVQEVGEDLRPLEHLKSILGPNWDYIATDVTEGPSGNKERMTFVFDRRKILFQNIVGEIVLPKASLIGDGEQFARTPFSVAFQAGWFKFSLCTVHIYFGDERGAKLKRRIAEIDSIAKFLAKRAKKEKSNMILLGDFNIVSPEHETMEALLRAGFTVPEPLRQKTNMMRDKFYDQIAFMQKRNVVSLGASQPNAGVYDPFNVLFTEDQHDSFNKISRKPGQYYQGKKLHPKDKWNLKTNGEERPPDKKMREYLRKWRTWQISDHLPLWVELKINFTDDYLKSLLK